MKFNSMIAFFLALIALAMILGLVGWTVAQIVPGISRSPDYCEHFFVEMSPEFTSTQLEVGEGKLIKINITNYGFEDQFKVRVDGPDWIVARPLKIRLGQDKSDDIFVYMSPTVGSEGNYTVTVFVESYCGIKETQLKVKV